MRPVKQRTQIISCEHTTLLNQEQRDTLAALNNGVATFTIATNAHLPFASGPAHLLDKWQSELLDERLEQPLARATTGKNSNQTSEDWSQATPTNYQYNEAPAHTRRIRMLADLIWHEAKRRTNAGEREIVVLDIGAGDLTLQLLLRKDAAKHPHINLTLAVADINPTPIEQGVALGIIDRGIVWDWTKEDLSSIVAKTGGSILVFAEVLEHIQFVRANFMQTQMTKTTERYACSVVGSVPNGVMFVELAGYLQGTVAPWQLEKAMTNPTFDHISHFTYASLGKGLMEAGYTANDIYITSNAIYLSNDEEELSYGGALRYPQLGHRLIFMAMGMNGPQKER